MSGFNLAPSCIDCPTRRMFMAPAVEVRQRETDALLEGFGIVPSSTDCEGGSNNDSGDWVCAAVYTTPEIVSVSPLDAEAQAVLDEITDYIGKKAEAIDAAIGGRPIPSQSVDEILDEYRTSDYPPVLSDESLSTIMAYFEEQDMVARSGASMAETKISFLVERAMGEMLLPSGYPTEAAIIGPDIVANGDDQVYMPSGIGIWMPRNLI